jgi:cysteinyl-tRNA synthetase
MLGQDLATPAALALLSHVSQEVQITLVHPARMNDFINLLAAIDRILGTRLSEVSDITSSQKDLIRQREKARHDKDWANADEIRQQLSQQGIGLNDRANYGAIWYYL